MSTKERNYKRNDVNDLSVFGNRLLTLCQSMGLRQEGLGNALLDPAGRGTVNAWQHGVNYPSIDRFVNIVALFGQRPDVLLGFSDDPQKPYDRFVGLLEEVSAQNLRVQSLALRIDKARKQLGLKSAPYSGIDLGFSMKDLATIRLKKFYATLPKEEQEFLHTGGKTSRELVAEIAFLANKYGVSADYFFGYQRELVGVPLSAEEYAFFILAESMLEKAIGELNVVEHRLRKIINDFSNMTRNAYLSEVER
jgi:transcriptional regulator with XRE-family HTH domain